MAESVAQIRNRLRGPRRAPTPHGGGVSPIAPDSFVLENRDTGRVVITSPLETADYKATDFYMDLRGRLVEAERANRNGAFWAQADLEFGLPTVAYGPLNWAHDPRAIVGTLLNPVLIKGEKAAQVGLRPYIQTDARFWNYLAPERAALLERYARERKAYLSMECVSNEIQCVGPNGCGAVMPYGDAYARTGAACEHVRERSSYRRFVNPIFQGAAVIVPPQSPGWADASITEILHDAEAQAEAANLHVEGLTDEEAVAMVTAILQWSGKRD